ncbi:MAG: terminase family protein [Chloroflexota bacterium]|nr:terminase family protein [Chloroflexota bacterium]
MLPPSYTMPHLWPVQDQIEMAQREHAATGESGLYEVEPFGKWLHTTSPGWGWDAPHLHAIRTELARIDSGEINQLIITMPPRHMKTEHTTVRYTAWRLQQNPRLNVIIGAYNQTIANRFSRKVRRIVRAHSDLSTERYAQSEWETPEGGTLRAAGVNTGVTGMGGNLIVIDDPIKNRREADSLTYRDAVWEWFTDDLFSRREGDWAIIIIMTRWHQDDLVGRLLDSDDAPNWEVLHLPAIYEGPSPYGTVPDFRTEIGVALWPSHFDVDELQRTRMLGEEGERGWHALYQGLPTATGGAIFMRDWWQGRARYDAGDEMGLRRTLATGMRFIDWDTAETLGDGSAYSACTVGELHQRGDGYVIRIRAVHRAKLTFPDLMAEVYRMAEEWNQDGNLRDVAIELASSGRQVYQQAQAEGRLYRMGVHLQGVPVTQSKELRAQGAAHWCRMGRVELPESAAFLPMLESELYSFPQSAQKDMVDSMSQQIYRWASWLAPCVF